MDDGEEEHAVGDLSMEPDGLVKRQPSDLGPDHSQDVPAHGHDNDHSVDREHQTSTSRNPDRVPQSIEGGETIIIELLPPVSMSA